jgi:hypothetical protein
VRDKPIPQERRFLCRRFPSRAYCRLQGCEITISPGDRDEARLPDQAGQEAMFPDRATLNAYVNKHGKSADQALPTRAAAEDPNRPADAGGSATATFAAAP